MMVSLSLRHMLKAETLVEATRSIILQSDGQGDSFPALMCLIDHVLQHSATDTKILMEPLDLYFAYFDDVDSIEYLHHSDALAANLNDRDMPPVPALLGMAHVTNFIPATKRCHEQLRVNTSPQLFKPTRVLHRRGHKSVANAGRFPHNVQGCADKAGE